MNHILSYDDTSGAFSLKFHATPDTYLCYKYNMDDVVNKTGSGMSGMPGKNPEDLTSPEESVKIRAEQVRLLYKNASISMIGSLVNSVLLAVILWSVTDRALLMAWVAGIFIVTAFRYYDVIRFRRASDDPLSAVSAEKRFVAATALSGVAWGASGLLISPDTSVAHQAFLAFVLGGMVIGSAGAYAVVRRAFFAFSIPAAVPLFVYFLILGDSMHLAMSGMALLFTILMTAVALQIHTMTLTSIKVRYINMNLLSYLASAKEDAENLALDLSAEIDVRKQTEAELTKHREHLTELVQERTAELVAMNEQLRKEIQDRVRAEEALKLSEENFRSLIENSLDLITVTDGNGVILYDTPSLERLLGYSPYELRGRRVFDFVHHDDLMACRNAFVRVIERPGTVESIVVRVRHRSGSWSIFEAIGKSMTDYTGSTKVIINSRDITERRRMEEELAKVQKLESLGVLAGGLAHDFNNLLTGIMGYISLARMVEQPDARVPELLQRAEQASLRAKDLTRQLLTFARGGEPIKKVESLSGIIRDMSEFVLRGSGTKCVISMPDDLWSAEVDAGQIGQVIGNLVTNASEAMAGGGTVTVSGRNLQITPGEIPPLSAGSYVMITVGDHGEGIPEELIPKLFDPFFSTKPKGTGLGLTSAYSIMRRHKGQILVESAVGRGTAFHLYLPASGQDIETGVARDVQAVSGNGRVLLMDDEETVRDVAGEMLTSLGYSVTVTADGDAALQEYQKALDNGDSFDAVILDLTVPGAMGGKEAVRRLRDIDQGVRAIVSSGYSTDPVMADFRDYGFSGVVTKPYNIAELSEAVHSVMNGPDR